MIGASSEAEAREGMAIMDALATLLGVELHPTKLEGPARSPTYLGIIVDTVRMIVSLPAGKLEKIRAAVTALLQQGAATYRQLQQVLGLLQHASQVVQPGRLLSSDLRQALRGFRGLPAVGGSSAASRAKGRQLSVPGVLPSEAQRELRWWLDCVGAWNGRSAIPLDTRPNLVLQTGAASTAGVGGLLVDLARPDSVSDVAAWFSVQWPTHTPSGRPYFFAEWASGALE